MWLWRERTGVVLHGGRVGECREGARAEAGADAGVAVDHEHGAAQV